MRVNSIQELKEQLIYLSKRRPQPIEGATETEIETVKSRQGVSHLPELYRQFLLEMGHSAGILYIGEDYIIEDLLELKTRAKERLEYDEVALTLPEDAFVFNMHQGYSFLFFLTANEDENPPVYRYYQSEDKFLKVADTLLDHYNAWLEYLVEWHKKYEAREQAQ